MRRVGGGGCGLQERSAGHAEIVRLTECWATVGKMPIEEEDEAMREGTGRARHRHG